MSGGFSPQSIFSDEDAHAVVGRSLEICFYSFNFSCFKPLVCSEDVELNYSTWATLVTL